MSRRRYLALMLAVLCLGLSQYGAAWAQGGQKARAAAAASTSASAAEPDRSPLVRVADGRMLAPDIARIVNHGELVVSMLATDNPPFFSVKNGDLVGTDIDLAKLIATELGVTLRFDRSYKTFDSVVEAVALGKVDIAVSRLGRTLKRAQMVHFSISYIKLGHAMLINRMRFAQLAGDRSLPQVVRDYTGTLGVLAGSSWEEFGRRNFPKAKLVRYPTWPDLIEAAKKGEVTAVYRDEMEVVQLMREEPGLALTLRTVTFSDLEAPLSVVVGIRDLTLLSFVNELIAQRAVQPTADSVLKALK
ncbi:MULTISPECIES: ABC transporter substrate-binding protein [unclassified Duganella]|uniref:substrate-binding periplasmic protein n=1 Tax=unclassified Duganella TaxID=2636909 RepID=UPI000E34FD2C|nr:MULTISPECIES: ABC transporter substrate-binding protein [unclassified Duganella]RFP08976.1 amino acid ABC transporter substrate-binding protein [Duganella sp. BJB475]RFP23913.1 amino acid ABC transporter substrate-binding protein [Duganella sp. BJB476]